MLPLIRKALSSSEEAQPPIYVPLVQGDVCYVFRQQDVRRIEDARFMWYGKVAPTDEFLPIKPVDINCINSALYERLSEMHGLTPSATSSATTTTTTTTMMTTMTTTSTTTTTPTPTEKATPAAPTEPMDIDDNFDVNAQWALTYVAIMANCMGANAVPATTTDVARTTKPKSNILIASISTATSTSDIPLQLSLQQLHLYEHTRTNATKPRKVSKKHCQCCKRKTLHLKYATAYSYYAKNMLQARRKFNCRIRRTWSNVL